MWLVKEGALVAEIACLTLEAGTAHLILVGVQVWAGTIMLSGTAPRLVHTWTWTIGTYFY